MAAGFGWGWAYATLSVALAKESRAYRYSGANVCNGSKAATSDRLNERAIPA